MKPGARILFTSGALKQATHAQVELVNGEGCARRRQQLQVAAGCCCDVVTARLVPAPSPTTTLTAVQSLLP